jgi:hypothetical protein
MDYKIVIVPPGGGEADFTQDVKGAEFVPRAGEYVVIAVDSNEEETRGVEAYLVRYPVTNLTRKDWGDAGIFGTTVEVEPVRHPYQSKRHGKMCERYDGHWGHPTKDYPESGY